MATISTYHTTEGTFMSSFVSDRAQPADTVLMEDLGASFPHCFLGIRMYDGAGALVTSGATGTVAVTVRTTNNGQYESITVGTIDASAPVTVDWAANTDSVSVVPTSLAGITDWEVVVTCNRS